MLYNHRATRPARFLLWAVVLPALLQICTMPVHAEEQPPFLAAFRSASLTWVADSILSMPEIARVDREIPGGLRGLLPPDLLPMLSQSPALACGVFLDGKDRLRYVIRRGDTCLTPGEGSGQFPDLMQLLVQPSSPSGAPAAQESLPAFPPDLEKAEIAGWIAPAEVARLLAKVLEKESGLKVRRSVAVCASNCRRICRLLTKAGSFAAQLRQGEAVSLAGMPSCPFGGRYLFEKTTASGTKLLHQIRCDHTSPATPPLIPETPLGKMMGVALEQLKALPVLTLTYSASAGVLRAELPVVLDQAGYALPGTRWTPDYSSMLGWVPAESVKLPISAGFPGGIFLGIDPRRLFENPDAPADSNPLSKLTVKPGLVLLGGATPHEGFSRRGGFVPNPVFGVFTAAKDLLPVIASMEPGMAGNQTTVEIEGTDVTVLSPDGKSGPLDGEDAGMRVVEHDGITFLSFEKRFVRELLRSWNGESPLVALPELRGEVKFVLAVRMDVFGHAVAGIVNELSFQKEQRQCGDAIHAYRRTQAGKAEAADIPAELRDACPRKGIMWHPEQKRVMCAVHDVGWRARQLASAARRYQIPADRWLFVTLQRHDGKAVLEARIVTGREVAQ